MLEGQADRHHHHRRHQRPRQVMVPGGLTAFPGQAAVTGQTRPRPTSSTPIAAPASPKQPQHGDQRPDHQRRQHQGPTPTVSRFSAISVVW